MKKYTNFADKINYRIFQTNVMGFPSQMSCSLFILYQVYFSDIVSYSVNIFYIILE